MSRKTVALAATSCLIAGACSLLVDTSELTGVADAPDAVGDQGGDAGEGAGDGAPAVGDGSTVEGSDASAPFKCFGLAPPATFCDDFDEKPFGFGWTTQTTAPGSVTRDTNVFRSGPAGLVARTPAVDAGYPAASLRHDELIVATRARVAFDLRMSEFPNDPPLVPFRIFVTSATEPAGASGDLYLEVRKQSVSLAERPGPFSRHACSRYFLTGTWTHVEVEADFGKHELVVKLDGVEVLRTASATTWGASRFGIGLGRFSSGNPPYPAFDVNADNVTLRLD